MGDYFIRNYENIRLPIASQNEEAGLRNPQLGAIHAVASHFTIDEDTPALVTMPTGSGKTVVLIIAPFLLLAKRVLVISSSILVRGQIVEEFRFMHTLKNLKVIPENFKSPNVEEIKSPIESKEIWVQLKKYDVVIGIPNSISPGLANENHSPENDFFDLILVDEAHHTPAKSWSTILDYFPNAKKILFTATPFRRDKKEIPGKIVYNYPLSRAQKDKIFGSIQYYPVKPDSNVDNDLALALEAEKIFKLDKESGLEHYVMVRTETKKHAAELEKIYSERTTLRLKKVDSSKTYPYIIRTIKSLKSNKIDGIICVDMLGEGFDFPNLKIAVLHKTHKSLAITLQFIGRFARTNAKKIGQAKFLAIPNEIKVAKSSLYEENAIWDELIVDLSEQKIFEEDKTKKFIHSFEKVVDSQNEETISLYNISPYCHVKIYRVLDFNSPSDIEVDGQQTVHYSQNLEEHTFVLITKELSKPKWLITDELVNQEYFLYIIYYDTRSSLLFINSTFKTNEFYEFIASNFTTEKPEWLSKRDLHKVLHGLKETEFFNIGMVNRSFASGERYRIIAGPRADTTVKRSDARTHSNGHVFGKAQSEESESITIGYSSGSKVWSNLYLKIPAFVEWCKKIAAKINSNVTVKTNTGLDNLPIGVHIDQFPFAVFAASWDAHSYLVPPILTITDPKTGEVIEELQLFDFEIVIDKEKSNDKELLFSLVNDERVIYLKFDFANHYNYAIDPIFSYIIDGESDIISYLNENPLMFFLEDFSLIIRSELHQNPSIEELRYESSINYFDWEKHNTDITVEFYDEKNPRIIKKADNDNKCSIHECLDAVLKNENPNILIYDHRSGEIADYIAIDNSPHSLNIRLYHCKGSTGIRPGLRVGDLYEVCGQAIKCLLWTNSKAAFSKKLLHRINTGSKFIIGDATLLNKLLDTHFMLRFSVCVVQPGLSKTEWEKDIKGAAKLGSILASAENYIQTNGRFETFEVIGSIA